MSIKIIYLICFAALGVSTLSAQAPYTPGEFQSANPNYPTRNPFYFEGRIDWNLLKISTPSNAWEFAQRGIMKQDDTEDFAGAIADYQQAYQLNNLGNGSCQLVTVNAGLNQTFNPPPCMFTFRLRLAYLLSQTAPQQSLGLYQEVLQIDPLRLGVNQLIGDTMQIIANQAAAAGDAIGQAAALSGAVTAYQAELALSPVTQLSITKTGDMANNAHTHWSLAQVYNALADPHEACELNYYLQATQWHSDTYVWRIQLAQTRLANLTAACPDQQPSWRAAQP
jgi:hypothetical protein